MGRVLRVLASYCKVSNIIILSVCLSVCLFWTHGMRATGRSLPSVRVPVRVRVPGAGVGVGAGVPSAECGGMYVLSLHYCCTILEFIGGQM